MNHCFKSLENRKRKNNSDSRKRNKRKNNSKISFPRSSIVKNTATYIANAANFFNAVSHNNKSLSTQQYLLQQLNHKTAAQNNMFSLEILMQHRNEMTTNVIKQIINVGFGTPNLKTWNISQLQKEA